MNWPVPEQKLLDDVGSPGWAHSIRQQCGMATPPSPGPWGGTNQEPELRLAQLLTSRLKGAWKGSRHAWNSKNAPLSQASACSPGLLGLESREWGLENKPNHQSSQRQGGISAHPHPH